MVLSDTAIDLAGTFPSNVLIVYAWTRMLRMRSPALFFVVLLALIAVVVLGRNGVGSIARLAFVVIGFGVVPFAFSSDRPLRKLLVIALMNAMIVVAEAVSIAAWYAVVGLDITDYDVVRSHMGAFVCTHILHLLVLTALFSGFHAALGRFDRTGAVDMRGFVWFPVIQAVLLGAALANGQADASTFTVPLWLMVLCSLVMGLGTSIGGYRIIKSVGMDMVKLKPYQGFAADFAATLCLLLSSLTGIPVSTTHTKTTSIMGVGAARRMSNVNWSIVKDLVLTWVCTFPGCGLLGYIMAKLFLLWFA